MRWFNAQHGCALAGFVLFACNDGSDAADDGPTPTDVTQEDGSDDDTGATDSNLPETDDDTGATSTETTTDDDTDATSTETTTDDDTDAALTDVASTDTTDDGAGPADELDACGNAAGQLFPPKAPWNTNVAAAAVDAESEAIIGYLQTNHTASARFQIDFSLRILTADDSVTHRAFTPTGDFYSGECDPAPMPVPEGGSLEGESGYACDSDGDCHLIVFDTDECRLFEMWRADLRGEEFRGGCMAVWEVDQVYGPEGRGDYCTSADAAGLPIAPLVFDADEVYAGSIEHAVRFILPNALIREDIYVRPGTHSTGATSGPAAAPPYAARLRLKSNVDVAGLSPGARVVARALQQYGMILADGGNLTFTARSDRDTVHSWEEAELDAQDMKGLSWADFEVVELGERIAYSGGDCTRSPITE